MNAYRERIEAVREYMKCAGVNIYIVCNSDYHMSEYAGEYYKEREFLSGFTGSAGTLVVSDEEAWLFTDGRYYVQAQKELADTTIGLMKSGSAGVPTVVQYCMDNLKESGVIGLDARTVRASMGLELEAVAEKKHGQLVTDFNPVCGMWKKRPPMPCSKAIEIDCGEERADKLKRVRKAMAESDCENHVVASLDDICWLFNIRGRDIACNPVVMSYAVVRKDTVTLYSDKIHFSNEIIDRLEADGISLAKYGDVYDDCMKLTGKVLVDRQRVNYALYKAIGGDVVEQTNPTVHMKAVKNTVEIANLKAVHIEDGLALTRFICDIKRRAALGEKVTEAEAANMVDRNRALIKDYIEPSFDTISAWGANAAMMHYHADEQHTDIISGDGMLLVDSGGQYLRGTTDVTRTIALGNVTKDMKRHYTLTLKGMLALADARFLKGCTGYNLDILARQYLWNEGIDYRCGTGHGIGYMLNVHEAPNAFRWRLDINNNDWCVIEPGMVTSDEPGVYIEDGYGIRIENELLCVAVSENEYGEFLGFEMLTCVPLEPELIDETLLDAADKERLNKYNRWVYTSLSPYMSGEGLEYLKSATKEVV